MPFYSKSLKTFIKNIFLLKSSHQFKISFGLLVLHLLKQAKPMRNLATLGRYILLNVGLGINRNFGGEVVLKVLILVLL